MKPDRHPVFPETAGRCQKYSEPRHLLDAGNVISTSFKGLTNAVRIMKKLYEHPLRRLGLKLVSFYFFDQGGSIKLKKFGRLVFDPFGLFQCLQDQSFFKFRYRVVQ